MEALRHLRLVFSCQVVSILIASSWEVGVYISFFFLGGGGARGVWIQGLEAQIF